LAQQALQTVDEVVFALPRSFPHKSYEGATLEQRIHMLLCATDAPVALFDTNYFFNMAEELQARKPQSQVHLLLGEDAAARLLTWDYGLDAPATESYLSEYLRQFPILTTSRTDQTPVPVSYRDKLFWLPTPPDAVNVSSTEVRQRIAKQQAWRHLVPSAIHGVVQELYCSPAS
jgi:nicotinic acid mononucleotide adenylyltransferase